MHQFHLRIPKVIYILSLYRILEQYLLKKKKSKQLHFNMNVTISTKIMSTNFVPTAEEHAKEDKI